jgi:hypothetical protein
MGQRIFQTNKWVDITIGPISMPTAHAPAETMQTICLLSKGNNIELIECYSANPEVIFHARSSLGK